MDAVCADPTTAPLDAKWRVLLGYVGKVNDTPALVTQADVDACLEAGWSEGAVFDAATVCSIFNFFNRWIDATGVPGQPEGFYEGRLAEHGDQGYRM